MAQTPGVYIADAAVGTVTGPTRNMLPDNLNGWTFHNVWTGTATATLKFYGSNDPAANPRDESAAGVAAAAAAEWVEITSSVTNDDPAGSAGNDMVIISNSRFAFIRMDVTGTSGAGNFRSWDCSHGIG